jgi:diguanylate cyclase (GGDEF)-like protein
MQEMTGDPTPDPGRGPRVDPPAREEPTRILIIDDDERILRLLAHHLGRHGYDVRMVTSSREGLRLVSELRPQILITDWTMPEISGLELCGLLSRTEAGQKMHKIMLTAREDDDQVVVAFDAGADDYVFKPFNPRILLARVRSGERMIRMREKVERSERVTLEKIAELGILTRKLRAAALTDPLTELPNRRFAISRLKQEWEAASRAGRLLSVTMADIDHFKRVNDLYGHDVGDVVLREAAAVLRAQCRQADVLCRLGGEEFLVIHVDSSLDAAVQCAERLRREIEHQVIRTDGYSGTITMSMGVAQRAAEMRGIDDLLKLADQALYEAKSTGRNRVVSRGPSASGALSA